MPAPFIVSRETAPRTLDVVGEKITVLASGAQTGSYEMIAAPGTLVHLPAGTTHWFRFTAGGGEMVSMTSREGASHMFADFDREIAPEAPDLQKLVTLGAQYGLKVPLDR